jgi:chromosome segregation ATPase
MTTLSTIIQEHEQEYASLELSETIHELQTQLQAALEVASGLKQENGHLRSSMQDTLASNAAQQRRYEEWRTSWKKEVELVSKREKQLLHDETAWNAKLADKRRELDQLEEQIIKMKDGIKNRNGDLTNAQGDNNQSIKIEHLEKAVDKWKKQFYEAQTNMSEKIQQIESKYLREAEMAKALRKEIASLQQLYAERFEKSNSTQQTKYQEKARELMLKVEEMDLVAEKLREEAKEMRKSRDEAIARCDELKAKHHVEHSVSHFLFCYCRTAKRSC